LRIRWPNHLLLRIALPTTSACYIAPSAIYLQAGIYRLGSRIEDLADPIKPDQKARLGLAEAQDPEDRLADPIKPDQKARSFGGTP
jgi:hypothetical protein